MSTTVLRPSLIASYSWDIDHIEACHWCPRPAVIRIVVTGRHLTDYACEACAAKHMHGNAHVLCPDEVPEPDYDDGPAGLHW